ncbi:MAG TPA: response regulator [Miltoncostaeaceae bacterium]|nr:response regulator [Miltoncostaeaceae bacterium]
MRAERVLVVDDEPQVLRGLTAALEAAGYDVIGAGTAAAALEAAALRPPDAVVLDLRLPDGSGVEVCRRLREWSQAPVVVVSAVDEEDEKIAALDAGADDYVTKPYAVGELLARVRAALRRSAAPAGEPPTVSFGDVEVDLARREVTRAGERVHLTPREYGLLAQLARHPGRVLTHAALLGAVWGPEYRGETHYLRVYMANLRRKLEADPARPRHLVTETGVGYRLRA